MTKPLIHITGISGFLLLGLIEWGFVEMYGHFLKFQKNAQADEICVLSTPQRKNGTGELFSSTSRPRIDYMQSIRSSRAALTVVADLPRFVFSPENIDTNLCVHVFPRICSKTPTHINGITGSGRQNRQHRLSSVGSLPSVILLICTGEIIQNASENAEDRDLRLEYMYAKSTVLSVPTTTVSVTRRKQMEMQDCFREREVEEAGRQALLFV